MSVMADVRKKLFTPGIFPLNESENINGNSEYNFRLSRWNSTASPNFTWKFHWKSSDGSGGFIPYVPGEGCFLYFRDELDSQVGSYTGEEKDVLEKMEIVTEAGAAVLLISSLFYFSRSQTFKFIYQKLAAFFYVNYFFVVVS